MNTKIFEQSYRSIKMTMGKLDIPIYEAEKFVMEIRENPAAFQKKMLQLSEEEKKPIMILYGFKVGDIRSSGGCGGHPYIILEGYNSKIHVNIYKELEEFFATRFDELRVGDTVAVMLRNIGYISGDLYPLELRDSFCFDIYKCQLSDNIAAAKDARGFYHIIDVVAFEEYEKENVNSITKNIIETDMKAGTNKSSDSKDSDNDKAAIGFGGVIIIVILIIILLKGCS